MQTTQFLASVLSAEGHYCTLSINLKTEETVQMFHTSIEDAFARAQEVNQSGLNAYFALATYETPRSRKAVNAKQLKSFFIDVDCGADKAAAGKGYIDQAAGIKALKGFCSELDLPKPTLVNSGRGIHVYWALTEAIDADVWVPVAQRLKTLCKKHKLHADPMVTANSAAVLRVPETFNYKDDPAKLVYIFGEPAAPVDFAAFSSLLGTAAVDSSYTAGRVDEVTNALAGSYSNSFKLIVTKTAAGKGCEQIKHILRNREDIGYDLWIAGLSIAKFCVDGEKSIHKLSDGHPEYDPKITERRAASIRGPYRCTTFDETNPGVCDNCQFKGKFGSPIVLGREVQEATDEDNVIQDKPEIAAEIPLQTYVIPQYPNPYFRGKAGGVFKKTKDKDGDPVDVPVYHNDLYITRRLHDPDVGESIVMRLHLPKDGVREFTVPLVGLLSKDDFRKNVAPKGVAVLNMGELMSYTNAWVNKLQATTAADLAHRQFGWTDDNFTAFVVGEKEIRVNRVEVNPPSKSTAGMFPGFQSKGTMEGWRAISDFYNRPNMEMHQYVIGLSFGSPFLAFTPINSSLFHMHSKESGHGKTTAMKAGTSIWGDPDSLVMKESDTTATKMNRCEIYKNIFVAFDELTNVVPKDASDFLYQLPSGLQRNRMSGKDNAERFRGAPWHFNACSTGNTSLIERIGLYKAVPKAEAMRVLEYRVEAYKFDSKAETDGLSLALGNHYGHACVPYMQYIMANLDECRQMFFDTQKRLDLAAGLSQPHRFWSAQAASSITGLLIAKKIGLISYKVSDIAAWLIEVLIKAREAADVMSGTIEDTLSSYLAENYNNILRIRSTDDSRSDEGLDHLIVPDGTPRMQLVARYEYDTKLMYLLPKPLKEWCIKNQHNYAALVQGFKDGDTKAVYKKARLGKGTHMKLPATDVWILEFKDLDLDLDSTDAATPLKLDLAD
jgi:hypothetical protein